LGSYICEALANLGHGVTTLDNLSSGSWDNLGEPLKSSRVKLIVGDCKDPVDVRKAIANADIIYHFAANPEVRLELADPLASERTYTQPTSYWKRPGGPTKIR